MQLSTRYASIIMSPDKLTSLYPRYPRSKTRQLDSQSENMGPAACQSLAVPTERLLLEKEAFVASDTPGVASNVNAGSRSVTCDSIGEVVSCRPN
jgi:hypothetical protein